MSKSNTILPKETKTQSAKAPVKPKHSEQLKKLGFSKEQAHAVGLHKLRKALGEQGMDEPGISVMVKVGLDMDKFSAGVDKMGMRKLMVMMKKFIEASGEEKRKPFFQNAHRAMQGKMSRSKRIEDLLGGKDG